MGDNTSATIPGQGAAPAEVQDKGKGKAVELQEDVSMGEEDDSSEDEEIVEDIGEDEDDDAGDDNLEPISAENIIEGGRRTRGKTIDYAEAAEKAGQEADDEDDDDDFRAPEQDTEMKG